MADLTRRTFAIGALSALTAHPALLKAQPTGQPARILVGYPPGGTLDQTARRISEAWRRQGRSFIVENRAGAAGRIANAALKRERPDGSVLLCTHTSALTIYPHVYSKLMYDAETDFVPVSPVVAAPCAVAVSASVPASVRTLSDYARWAADGPGRAFYASPAAGSVAHFLGFQFSQASGVKLEHVAYRGSAPAMQDLLGGQIPCYFGFVTDFLPYMQSGKIRVLGVAGDKRSRFIPQVPTFAEQGFPNIKGSESYALFAPPSTPMAMVLELYEAVAAAVRDKATVTEFEGVGLEPFTLRPLEFAQRLKRERDAWRPVVQASGFRLEE
jgi:tripartite-type tricarboxylate transporter receptor subunit TctC